MLCLYAVGLPQHYGAAVAFAIVLVSQVSSAAPDDQLGQLSGLTATQYVNQLHNAPSPLVEHSSVVLV